jgi:hypothetical protein
MTTTYPVHYAVERATRFTRMQLLIRVVAFCALGVLGVSFGAVFFFAYLALPVVAAVRLANGHDGDRSRIVAALRWFAAISAWTGLIVENLPGSSPPETVRVEVEGTTRPTAASAMWRLVTGIPSAIVLAILCWFGAFVWLWAALSILFVERVGPHAHAYLVGLQRWSVRLLAYQASLVDTYPPFSFDDLPPSPLPVARVAT